MDTELTPLATAAHGLHEWYSSLVGAGFTPDQAIKIVCTGISGAAEEKR